MVAGTSDARSRAQANAGRFDACIRWLDAEQDCPANLPLIRVEVGVLLPERWLERLLHVCSEVPDQVIAVFCEHADLMPLRLGEYPVAPSFSQARANMIECRHSSAISVSANWKSGSA